jgi:ribosomal protein S18 acetylase RimI-like enzyme
MAQTSIRLTAEHLERATQALGRAFENYPLMEYALPDAARRLRGTLQLYGSILRYGLAQAEVYTTEDVIGAACWLPPTRPFPSFLGMVRAGMLRVPFRFGWTGFQRLSAVDHVATALHRAHAPGPHWYLWAIGVAPEHQGRGVAGHLMQPVFARADADGLPCYLETHKEANVRIYERYGFTVAAQAGAADYPGKIWAMTRSPKR